MKTRSYILTWAASACCLASTTITAQQAVRVGKMRNKNVSRLLVAGQASAQSQGKSTKKKLAWLAQPNSWRNDARILIDAPEQGSPLTIRIGANGTMRITTDGKTIAKASPGAPLTWRDAKTGFEIKVAYGPEKKTRATLGVVVSEVPEALAAYVDRVLDDKVLVLESKKGGAAYKAGIRKHDILLEVDGASELSSAKLSKLIAEKKAGSKIEVVVLRRGKELEFDVELGAKEVATYPNFFYSPFQNGAWRTQPNQQGVFLYPGTLQSGKSGGGQTLYGRLPVAPAKPGTTLTPKVESSIEKLLHDLREQRERIDETLEKLRALEKKTNGK